jgi:hypothetical protein
VIRLRSVVVRRKPDVSRRLVEPGAGPGSLRWRAAPVRPPRGGSLGGTCPAASSLSDLPEVERTTAAKERSCCGFRASARVGGGNGNPRRGEIGEVRPCGSVRGCVDPIDAGTFGGAARTNATDRSEHAAGPDRAGGGAERVRVRGGRSGGVLGSVRAQGLLPRNAWRGQCAPSGDRRGNRSRCASRQRELCFRRWQQHEPRPAGSPEQAGCTLRE